jgi:hypothetical protein
MALAPAPRLTEKRRRPLPDLVERSGWATSIVASRGAQGGDLERGCVCYGRCAWADAYQALARADQALDRMVADRSDGNGAAMLTNPINIGTGTK